VDSKKKKNVPSPIGGERFVAEWEKGWATPERFHETEFVHVKWGKGMHLATGQEKSVTSKKEHRKKIKKRVLEKAGGGLTKCRRQGKK